MKERKFNYIANGQFVSCTLPSEGGPTQAVVFVKFKPDVALYVFRSVMWSLPAAFDSDKLPLSFTEYFLDHTHLHSQQHSSSVLFLQYLALTKNSEALTGYIKT